MGAGHDHGHAHSHAPPTGTAAAAYRGRLRAALSITLAVMVVEIVGGVLADSLALIADAAHMATDALGLGMALLAIHFANRPPTGNRTFGYARAEILAALANCLLLLGVGGYVLYEAIQRFLPPAATEGSLMVWFGAVGLHRRLPAVFQQRQRRIDRAPGHREDRDGFQADKQRRGVGGDGGGLRHGALLELATHVVQTACQLAPLTTGPP